MPTRHGPLNQVSALAEDDHGDDVDQDGGSVPDRRCGGDRARAGRDADGDLSHPGRARAGGHRPWGRRRHRASPRGAGHARQRPALGPGESRQGRRCPASSVAGRSGKKRVARDPASPGAPARRDRRPGRERLAGRHRGRRGRYELHARAGAELELLRRLPAGSRIRHHRRAREKRRRRARPLPCHRGVPQCDARGALGHLLSGPTDPVPRGPGRGEAEQRPDAAVRHRGSASGRHLDLHPRLRGAGAGPAWSHGAARGVALPRDDSRTFRAPRAGRSRRDPSGRLLRALDRCRRAGQRRL